MKLGEKIAMLRKEAGFSQLTLAAELQKRGFDVTNQAISKWEKGMTSPNAGQFLALCDALDVKDVLGEFLDRGEGLLRGLNSEGRARVAEYAELLRQSGKYEREVEEPVFQMEARFLPLYNLAVSAGTGQFLDGSDYETVEVGAEVPMAANYGVRVAGDSMEPDYHDGQVVWVRQQQTLQSGEIGVFLYEDNAYLKKLRDRVGGVRLQSLNTGYPDIVISDPDRFRILGKVL